MCVSYSMRLSRPLVELNVRSLVTRKVPELIFVSTCPMIKNTFVAKLGESVGKQARNVFRASNICELLTAKYHRQLLLDKFTAQLI